MFTETSREKLIGLNWKLIQTENWIKLPDKQWKRTSELVENKKKWKHDQDDDDASSCMPSKGLKSN